MKLGWLDLAWANLSGWRAPRSAAQVGILLHLAGYPGGAPDSAVTVLLSGSSQPVDRFLAGAVAAAAGEWGEVRRQEDDLEADARAAAERGDTQAAADLRAYASALRGYVAVRRGDSAAALRELEAALPVLPGSDFETFVHELLRIELGRLLLASERPREAARYLESREFYRSIYTVPGEYYLGQLYEALGAPERARYHYGRFVKWWEGCDPALRPWLDEGRRAFLRVAPDAAGSWTSPPAGS